jgi:hypothetical protein
MKKKQQAISAWDRWFWVNTSNVPISDFPVLEFVAPKGTDPSDMIERFFQDAQYDPAPYLPFVITATLDDAYTAYCQRYPDRTPGVWGVLLPEIDIREH